MNPLYQLRKVTFSPHDTFCLLNIDLEIQKHGITTIVGPNGAGKTSLLNLLALLHLSQDGAFIYKQHIVHQHNIAELRRQIGYVQQNPYLLRGCVYENISFALHAHNIAKSEHDKRINEVLEILNITHLSQRVARTLSRGEVQKVAIGQMLVLRPEVLILDEPFAHLDQYSIIELERIIRQLQQQTTIIFSTHDQQQAQRMADQRYSIIDGRIFNASMINFFHGDLCQDKRALNIGKHTINLAQGDRDTKYLIIDPNKILLSKKPNNLINEFCGSIVGLTAQQDKIGVFIETGEHFYATISQYQFKELDLRLNQQIWLHLNPDVLIAF